MRKTLEERFWEKVNKDGPLPDQGNPHYTGLDRCWEWTASCGGNGYGRISEKGTLLQANRVSFLIHGIAIPPGMYACHRCDNRKCVNPAHLFIGSGSENTRDCFQKGRGRSNLSAEFKARKYTDVEVRTMRAQYTAGETIAQIARTYGAPRTTIGPIVNRKRYANVGD